MPLDNTLHFSATRNAAASEDISLYGKSFIHAEGMVSLNLCLHDHTSVLDFVVRLYDDVHEQMYDDIEGGFPKKLNNVQHV